MTNKLYDPHWRKRSGVVWAYGLGLYLRSRGTGRDKGPFRAGSAHARAWEQGWDDYRYV